MLHAKKPNIVNGALSESFGLTDLKEEHDLLDADGPLGMSEEVKVHPDTNQIKLDTDRSFVYYPVGIGQPLAQKALYQ